MWMWVGIFCDFFVDNHRLCISLWNLWITTYTFLRCFHRFSHSFPVDAKGLSTTYPRFHNPYYYGGYFLLKI